MLPEQSTVTIEPPISCIGELNRGIPVFETVFFAGRIRLLDRDVGGGLLDRVRSRLL